MAQRKILIVDDEAGAGAALGARLGGLGYEVATITADETIDTSARAAPELVVVDIAGGPSTKPAVVADELRRRWNVPVVFLAAEVEEENARQPTPTRPDRCVVMPCTDRELRLVIELALCEHDAERAVDALEDRFFASSVDMLCFLDFSGRFKRLSPSWERTLGFTREELTSRPFIEFVHPDDRERTLGQNASVRAGGQALGFENRYLCRDGSYRWFRWNATPDAEARVIYAVARDITHGKQAEEERERLVRELQDALAEVKTLREILPICSYCKKIRDDENYWHSVESYFALHTATRFSHGICPSCMETEIESQIRKLDRE